MTQIHSFKNFSVKLDGLEMVNLVDLIEIWMDGKYKVVHNQFEISCIDFRLFFNETGQIMIWDVVTKSVER
jgi:hypothetical protein